MFVYEILITPFTGQYYFEHMERRRFTSMLIDIQFVLRRQFPNIPNPNHVI